MTETICLSNWECSIHGEAFKDVTLPHQPFTEPSTITTPTSGTVIYRLNLFAKEEWRSQIVNLHICSAMQRTKVFVNDKYLFSHFGGYQRFIIPLSDELNFNSENIIRLEVDSTPSDDCAPGKPISGIDFCYFAGLQQKAYLTISPPLHISDELEVSIPGGGGVFLRTISLNGTTATILGACHLLNTTSPSRRFEILGKESPYKDITCALTVSGPKGEIISSCKETIPTLKYNQDHTFCFNFEIKNAPLWSCDNPQLCTAHFEITCQGLVIDAKETRFGIRTIRFDRKSFYLNDKPIFLMGTNRHMEFPFVGNAAPDNPQKRDAILIKNAGHNFIRLSHYNQPISFIEACDELGLLVMAPIPGWQHYSTNSTFIDNVFRDCRELVRTLRNHPSVIIWEVSLNESYPPAWINEQMHTIAHQEYPGCYTAGDTIGNYEGWDIMFFHDKLTNTEKPIINREYGDWCFGGNESTSRRDRKDGLHALMGQAWNYQWSMNTAISTGLFVGICEWCFINYNRGCHPLLENDGSIDLFRVPKPKYYLYQSQNHPTPMVKAFRNGDKLIVFSNCDTVTIRQNGCDVITQKPDSGPNTPYNPKTKTSPGWETALLWCADASGGNPYDGGNCRALSHPPFTFINPPSGDIEVIAKINGKEVACEKLLAPTVPVSVELTIEDQGLPPSIGDLVFVTARLKDENGTIVPESRRVTFSSTNCTILGDNGPTTLGITSCLLKVDALPIDISAKLEECYICNSQIPDTVAAVLRSLGMKSVNFKSQHQTHTFNV